MTRWPRSRPIHVSRRPTIIRQERFRRLHELIRNPQQDLEGVEVIIGRNLQLSADSIFQEDNQAPHGFRFIGKLTPRERTARIAAPPAPAKPSRRRRLLRFGR